jgi:predicted porin
MAASFWLEAQFNTDNGTGVVTSFNNQSAGAPTCAVTTTTTTTTTARPAIAGTALTSASTSASTCTPAINGALGLTFNRRSTVSLSGPWGEVRLGRDYTGHYRNRVDTDPFSVVGVGATQVNVGSLAGPTSTRASNAIGYFLPGTLGGFFGQAQYYFGENASGAATSHDGNGYSLRAGYARGPWTVSGAYARQTFAGGDIVSTNLGGIYDAQPIRIMAAVFRDKTHSPVPVTGRGFTLGGTYSIGNGDAKLALSRYGSDAGRGPGTRKLALGYVHNLSKRTALYATYAKVRNGGGASVALNGATTGANRSSSGFDLGFRHNF